MGKLWRIDNGNELKYISEALEGGLKGTFTKRLEEEWAKVFGVGYAISINSGTSALHSSLFACGVEAGDEVIVPPLTFSAPALAALQLNAVPVFADIDPGTFNIDPADIEKRITSRSKAIVAVSLYGLPADMDPIMAIARKYNLKVIEDNAECIKGYYQGRIAGSIGDMSIFTFERSKHLTTGAGGMITTNDEKLAERARKHSILGYTTLSAKQDAFKANLDVVQDPSFARHELLGYNYRLPEICAAMGLAQLEKIDLLVSTRQKIAQLYQEAIKGCSWLVPQATPEGTVNSYWTYVVKLDTSKVSWRDFRSAYLDQGGDRFYGAWRLSYLEPLFSHYDFSDHGIEYKAGLCPVAEEVQPRLIQFRTNYAPDLRDATKQADALRKTIEIIDKRG